MRIRFFLKNKKNYLIDSQGNTALEMAIVGPVFFLLLLGIFEVGMIMLIKTSMELAILETVRFGRTGSTVSGQTPSQTAIGLATTYSFGLIDPSKMRLTVTTYPSYGAIPNFSALPDNGSQDFGAPNQFAVYTLSYDWHFFTPLVGNLLSPSGFITIRASSVVMNEPS